jgi:thermostable 8-oxoguanine DNA glycosylase
VGRHIPKELATLRYVEHAKKQAGVVSNEDLRVVYESICSVPADATHDDIKTYLNSVCGIDGIGIRIAICMLARLRGKDFAPFDKYVLDGLRSDKVIKQDEHKTLKATNINTFPSLYMEKIVKKWREYIKKGHTPACIDERWIKLGKKK